MRKSLIALLTAVALLVAPSSAIAHPAHFGVYGQSIAGDSLANLEIGSPKNRQVSLRFNADDSGSVSSVRLFWIWNTSCTPGNYSCGNGGDIEVTLRPDNGSGQPSSTILATGVDLTPMGSPAYYHTVTFSASASVTAGTRYHLVLRNIASDPVNNFVSVDNIKGSSPAGTAALYKDGSGSWTTAAGHIPVFTLFHTDGSAHGPGAPYINVRSSSGVRTINGTSRVAQTMTPSVNTTVTGAAFRVRHNSGSGAMTLRLKNSSGSDMRTCSGTVSGTNWLICNFTSPYTIPAGSLHRLVASTPSGTSYSAWPLTEEPGMRSPWQFTDGVAQYTTNNGATWLTPSSADDFQAYLKLAS